MSSLALLLLSSLPAFAETPIRVATWNVETVGAPGTVEHEAAVDVLSRIGADIVAIQEVGSAADVANLQSLATALGYDTVVVASGGPWGSLRGAVLTSLPLLSAEELSAAELSLDPAANDLTRYVLKVQVDPSGLGDSFTLITTHWKSGSTNEDEFRRAVDSLRVAQAAAGLDPSVDAFVIAGDINAQVTDGVGSPLTFTAVPTTVPLGYVTGADVNAEMAGPGVENDPFSYLADTGALVVQAAQLDGSLATRPSSGRRIDYLLASPALSGVQAQIYDCADESLSGGLSLLGSPLDPTLCPLAADHLPVFADMLVPSAVLPNLAPAAEAGGPYAGISGAAVSFSSAASADPDGTIVSWAWTFGDGSSSTAANPSHSYAAAGTYTASLLITDDRGATSTDTATVTISAPPCAVTTTSATWTARRSELLVKASCSDTRATLSVAGDGSPLGAMTLRRGVYEYKLITTSPPSTVTVSSTCGGADTDPVLRK